MLSTEAIHDSSSLGKLIFDTSIAGDNYPLFPSEAIHQRILLYNKLVIAWAIT